MSDMANEEPFLTLIDAGNIKHIMFHGEINKTTAVNLITTLFSINSDYIKASTDTGMGFKTEISESDIEAIKKQKIILHLSSNGGGINSAFMVADCIKNLDINVDCLVDGPIASASIIILLACRNRAMQPHANIYMHETVHTCDSLYFSELSTFVKEQEIIFDSVVSYYSEKTNLDKKQVKKYFSDLTILNEAKAKELGFINATVKELLA